ncbi:MAG: DUF3300 domain-containing protein [Methyloprofundus sp.]|nr:DUF3300 domain-containing protein [Methyloprofundus sp.]
MRKLLTIFGNILFTIMLCLSLEGVQAGGEILSKTELEQMMSPVALYPDVLLIQILRATTYPVDVIEAVNWSKNNPGKHGDAALMVVRNKYWDLSVISLLAFPRVLAMMGRQPEWVQNTGSAYLANPEAIMGMVQELRWRAREANKLETIEQKVVVDPGPSTETITIIEPAESRVTYLPSYNSTIVYGTGWSPYYRPRYYDYYRPRYYSYYRPRFYNPDFRSWYYPFYGYGYGYGYGSW